jgi:hypothetical protein
MNRIVKVVGAVLIAAVPAALIAAYSASCRNAGQTLSWDQFSEGLLSHTSNCGGNSDSASNCRQIALTIRVAAGDSNDIYDFNHLSKEYRNDLVIATRGWTGEAKYLLNPGPIHTETDTNVLVVVCDTPFDNVPQPTIWNLHRRSLMHAAGYSDGSVQWLTPEQFAALNKSNFIALNYPLQPVSNETNSLSF